MAVAAEQRALFRPPPALAGLGPAQDAVLRALWAARQMTADEAGELAHRLRECACAERECEARGYWLRDGRELLSSLRRRGLLRRRRADGLWLVRREAARDVRAFARAEASVGA